MSFNHSPSNIYRIYVHNDIYNYDDDDDDDDHDDDNDDDNDDNEVCSIRKTSPLQYETSLTSPFA